MPILNIDPETGHVYVEDDARYRHKKFGTVYRLDQQGKILKTWDPYFIDIEESGLHLAVGRYQSRARLPSSGGAPVPGFRIRKGWQGLPVETQ